MTAIKTSPNTIQKRFSFGLFIFVMAILNLFLYTFFKPPLATVTELPYHVTALNTLSIISGTWEWQEGFVQSGNELALAVTPLRIDIQRLRVVVSLDPGSGITFAMTYPHKITESHYLKVFHDRIEAGFVDRENRWVTQFSKAIDLPRENINIILIVKDGYFRIELEGKPLVERLPLNFQGQYQGMMTFFSSRIDGLIFDRYTYD
jgi:hypothetical protein